MKSGQFNLASQVFRKSCPRDKVEDKGGGRCGVVWAPVACRCTCTTVLPWYLAGVQPWDFVGMDKNL